MTKTYAVIGDPIDHSLSPAIHNAAFGFLRMDCAYIAYRIPKGELPHKVDMIEFLDEKDENCKTIGATNTVVNNNNFLKGYNTDMDGFLDPIKKRNLDCRDSNVLLVGAGGAARAIVAGLAKEKVHKITIANRTKQRADELIKFANSLGVQSDYSDLDNAGNVAGRYKFIVNATSMGLKGTPSPISTKTITKDSIVYDIVYMPVETELIEQSKKQGATIIYGWEMLLGQAMRSFEIWTGQSAPYQAMKMTLLGRF